MISVTSGRGLPGNMTAEHDVLYTAKITFDVSKVYENGTLKFVTYTGGDGTVITGFQVDFTEQADQCLADAVTVLSRAVGSRLMAWASSRTEGAWWGGYTGGTKLPIAFASMITKAICSGCPATSRPQMA